MLYLFDVTRWESPLRMASSASSISDSIAIKTNAIGLDFVMLLLLGESWLS